MIDPEQHREANDLYLGVPEPDAATDVCECGHWPNAHISGDGPCRRCSCHTYRPAPDDETLTAIERGAAERFKISGDIRPLVDSGTPSVPLHRIERGGQQ
jgi:hypothetical protein